MPRRSTTILIALLGLALVGLFVLYRTRGVDIADGHLCAQAYAKARSAADSPLADAQPPERQLGRGEFTQPRSTCGELRRLGQVR
jgi:hypothetical protein